MAVFDLREQRVCIRIVFDGAAGAGKTTNVRQLASLFAAQRATEIYTPAEIEGRTLYFDWIHLHGGAVCGLPLLCQVISAPGQVVLTERRRHLLATADAVVYVCDSGRAGLSLASEGLAVLDEVCEARTRPPELVIQANKQDQADAASAAEVAELLGRGGAPCIEAIACDGIGVIDTFVAAVRETARGLQARVERGELRLAVVPAERPEEVYATLDELEIDPEWAAELLLEEAARAFLAAAATGTSPASARVAGVPEGHAPFPRADVPAGNIWPAHTGRSRVRELAARGPRAVALDGSGGVTLGVAGYRLSTSQRARFEGGDSARRGIVQAARARTQLGALLAPGTVLVLQPASDREAWLWTITPMLPSVRSWVGHAPDPLERGRRVQAYAAAVGDALRCTVERGLTFDASMDRFGVDGAEIRYLGELTYDGPDAFEPTLARALGELSEARGDRAAFREALERHLGRSSAIGERAWRALERRQ